MKWRTIRGAEENKFSVPLLRANHKFEIQRLQTTGTRDAQENNKNDLQTLHPQMIMLCGITKFYPFGNLIFVSLQRTWKCHCDL